MNPNPPLQPLARDDFLESQARAVDDFFSELTDGESVARAEFEQLSTDTYDYLASVGQPPSAYVLLLGSTDSRFNWLTYNYPSTIEVPPGLKSRWNQWGIVFAELKSRNPRIALYNAMKQISETHFWISWPSDWEWSIDNWLLANDPTQPAPFNDHYGILTPEFYRELRDIRLRCGGMLYDNEHGRIVFKPDAEWEPIRAKMEAEAHRRRQKEIQGRFSIIDRGVKEIILQARSDNQLWEALKNWELQEEAKAECKSLRHANGFPDLLEVSGPDPIVVKIPIGWFEIAKTPVNWHHREQLTKRIDPTFQPFIDRVSQPVHAGVFDFLVMLALREAVRQDLGLPRTFSV